MPIRPGLLSILLSLAVLPAWGGPAVKVDLICDTDSVQPGSPLRVGLRFELQEHWHIYWRNPGDSGMPPQVRWKLPAGFRAGEIQWPAPERLGSGSVIDFGYPESVVLPVEIQTPANALEAGGTLTVSAEVSWLACKDVCVPGRAEVALSLPVRMVPRPAPESHALLQEAGSRLPKPLPSGWKAGAVSEKEAFVITVLGAREAKAWFFPFESDQIDHAAPQTAASVPGGVRLTLRKSGQLARAPARLEGVLRLGSGVAYAVSVPVQTISP
ncbi:MAG: hypothetical protein HGA66_01445 [Holophaga sp.]|nr:hypothetical protein [Holophaga sp.]